MTFAEDTTIYITEQKKSFRSCVSYIEHFATVSGLQCYIDKTVVVPLGKNFDINDKLCPDLVLNWDNKFTILNFEIDSKLETLNDNFVNIHKKVDKLRTLWQCYHLTIMERITIKKIPPNEPVYLYWHSFGHDGDNDK